MVKVIRELVGSRVRDTSYDDRVRIRLAAPGTGGTEGAATDLVLETEFRLRVADGQYLDMLPGTGSELAPVLDLFGQVVTAVERAADGSFVIAFDAGSLLWIASDARFGLSPVPRARG
ncbi:DUF6188 family protein [Streptomyces sp. NPDC026673]|uniref:DUF6188 family protein n=1 Tax=Streptomyces sp. NPDC026673 TaxID=3155724 RepID=UPI0033C977BB